MASTPPLAALTTVFTPPCPTSFFVTTTKTPSQYPSFPTNGPASCDPPSWDRNIADKAFQYYSPAICPSGFNVGPSCTLNPARTAQGFPAVENGETVVFCVPSGHTCTSDTTDFRGGVWGFTPGPAGAVTVAPAMQIRFKAADLSTLETHPLTPGLLLTTPTTPVAALDPTPLIPVPGAFSTIPAPRPPVLSALPRITQSTLVQLSTISTSGTTAVSLVTRTREITSPPDDATTSAPSPTQPNAAVSKETSTANPRTITAVIVLACLLFMILLAILGFLFLRRYRKSHAGRLDGLLPVGLGVWAKQGRKLASPAAWANMFRRKPSDAEIGTAKAPAELDGIEIGQRRWSWVLPVPRFRIFSMASWKALSSRPSQWEKLDSEKTLSPYAENFGRDRWHDGLIPPTPVYQSPRSTRSSPIDTADERAGGRATAMGRLSGFTSLSDGTFGRSGSPHETTDTNSSGRSSR